MTLLAREVETAKASLAEDLELAGAQGPARHLDALRLVDLKLRQLGEHLCRSRRILNDLRALRRLLLTEREPLPAALGRPAGSVEVTSGPFEDTTLMESDSAVPFSISASPKRDA